MTKKEFSKTVRIYKSHKLRNGFISVTYADILGPNTISTDKKVEIEDKGGALTSLFAHICPNSFRVEEATKHWISLYKEEIEDKSDDEIANALYEWFHHNWGEWVGIAEKENFYKELESQVLKSL